MKQKALSNIWGSALLIGVMIFASMAQAAVPIDFTDLVKSAGPAVVNINTERTEERGGMPPGFRLFGRDPFMERFFEQFEESMPKRQRKTKSLGSGFIISEDGFIVTNNHVVEGAEVIQVTLGEKSKAKPYKAKVIGTDPDTDLALLKIEATGLPSLSFGSSDDLMVGEWVLAIGNPLGLDHTVTAGIVSAKGRNIQSGSYDDFLQTDASINPGNSGGPLLNMKGEVIGINAAIAQYAQGIGFAIPSTLAQKIINDLKDHKKISRGWFGVKIQPVDDATAKALGMKEAQGALVGEVIEGQPAEKAGIKSGDVILRINGENIDTPDVLLRKVALLTPGEKAEVTLWRGKKEVNVSLIVSERDGGKSSSDKSSADSNTVTSERLGLTVRPMTSSDAARLGVNEAKGLLITSVKKDSLGAMAGFRSGDSLLAVNNIALTSAKELEKTITKAVKEKGAVLFQVLRNGTIYFKAIDLSEDVK